MVETLLVVMGVVTVLYGVLGGADFGVGMIEPWLGSQAQERVDRALLPVWEANHIWLILLVVLGFVAFPAPFALLTIALHIPLLMVLLGIVARGSAFTFRHYDPESGALETWYSWSFRFGSLLTPLFLGVIAAASVEGNLPLTLQGDFYADFIAPWNTPFCWATGAFTCSLFAFEGAALLAAELGAKPDGSLPYLRLARRLHVGSIALGGVLLVMAWRSESASLHALLLQPANLACQLVATLLIPVVALAFRRGRPWLLRVASGAQIGCILVGLWGSTYPTLVFYRGGAYGIGDVAPASVLRALLVAVGIGLMLIVPALGYLLRVYKLPAS
jgi:cytochrome d ubiquinol oxidase subunit II